MARKILSDVDIESRFKSNIIKYIYTNHIELVTKWSTKYSLYLGRNSKRRLKEIIFNWFYEENLLVDYIQAIRLINIIDLELTEGNDPNQIKKYIVLNFMDNNELKVNLINKFNKSLLIAKNEIFEMERKKNNNSSDSKESEEDSHSSMNF